MLDARDNVPATCTVDLYVDDTDAPSQLDIRSMLARVIPPSALRTPADEKQPIVIGPYAGDPGTKSTLT